MTVRALIVEDEPLARRGLVDLVAEIPWLHCVGTASDGLEATRLVDDLRPDLLFLDVELPEMSGLEVLERVRHRPMVVFTTAYDRYAVAAFELGAVDYLVKPFGRARFRATLERIERRIEAGGDRDLPPITTRLREGLSDGPLRRLFVRKGRRIVPVDISRVAHLAASGDYVELAADDEKFLVQISLSELERRLDRGRFLRVHRSHLVNLDHVERIEPHDDRRLAVILRGGDRVVASRSGSRRLRELVS